LFQSSLAAALAESVPPRPDYQQNTISHFTQNWRISTDAQGRSVDDRKIMTENISINEAIRWESSRAIGLGGIPQKWDIQVNHYF